MPVVERVMGLRLGWMPAVCPSRRLGAIRFCGRGPAGRPEAASPGRPATPTQQAQRAVSPAVGGGSAALAAHGRAGGSGRLALARHRPGGPWLGRLRLCALRLGGHAGGTRWQPGVLRQQAAAARRGNGHLDSLLRLGRGRRRCERRRRECAREKLGARRPQAGAGYQPARFLQQSISQSASNPSWKRLRAGANRRGSK